MTVIFAIEPGDPDLPDHARGSVERPRRWIRCLRAVGTTTKSFVTSLIMSAGILKQTTSLAQFIIGFLFGTI
jgi:hypothetical protein